MITGGPLISFVASLVSTLLCAGVSLVIFFVAKRRRHPDGEPHCRKCDYNLRGASISTDRCPECGLSIVGGANIVRGTRIPARRVVVAAAIMLTVTLLVGGGITTHFARQVDWYAVQPTWLLMQRAHSSYVPNRTSAFALLVPRAVNDGMSQERKRELCVALADHLTKSPASWKPAWGSFLVEQVCDGKLAEAQREQVLLAMLTPANLKIRPRVRRGDEAWALLTAGTRNAWEPGRLSRIISPRTVSIRVDGQPVPNALVAQIPSDKQSGFKAALLGETTDWAKLTRDSVAGLDPGEHEIEVCSTITLLDSYDSDKPLAILPIKAKARFIVVPEDEETVKLVQPAEYVSQMPQVLKFDLVYVPKDNSLKVNVSVERALPFDLAFQMFISKGRREWDVKDLPLNARQRGGIAFTSDAAGILPGTYDVILRPDKSKAAASLDMTEIWGGEVVIKNVVVREQK